MPILEYLKDPMPSIVEEEPSDLSSVDMQSDVKKWIKMEEMKLNVKRIKILESNNESLYALIWGQLSHALQEVVKGDDDFIANDISFNCIWLLQQIKLVSSGVDAKANKHFNFVQALTSFCTIKQGTTEEIIFSKPMKQWSKSYRKFIPYNG